jgi:hypothetical protein
MVGTLVSEPDEDETLSREGCHPFEACVDARADDALKTWKCCDKR